MPKEHDVFISYAEPDRKMAKILQQLFKAVGISSFFAKEALRKSPQDWEDGIFKKGLKQSGCFVPIFSKHSINRKWVIFETGAATALGIRIFATRVEGIELNEVREFPRAHRLQHLLLSETEDIKALLENIGERKFKDDEAKRLAFLTKLDEIFDDQSTNERSKLVHQLVCEAKKRWVFIAGNIPNNKSGEVEIPRGDFQTFVKSLAICLFKFGFSLSACPQVPDVGRIVLDTSEEYISKDGACGVHGCEVDYEIAGIYPVDQQLRSSPIASRELETEWRKHLLKFRRSYLENKDWLIVIGGNLGTKDEFEAVKEINNSRIHGIRVCFVPHFGGTGKKLLEDRFVSKHPHLYINGCKGWSVEAGVEKLAENVARIIKAN